ncbi:MULTISPECIES: LysM peptidoglycan-binding domain-containing protein [Aquimarina]|uniref:LysM peptidoglycan-binding domain-containing protein n=1 Tax=Aquimarina TaxID=290174 RepID=UPI000417973F|nr:MULTISPECIES: LysM peptidoglycan-binding domain-containing protein [Aquimarina]
MSQEAEKISNYESEAVQKNKAVMKSKFAERYQRMQDRKNDRGVAPNFNTFVTNAVDKPGLKSKEKIVVASVTGPKEIKAGEIATYSIATYDGGTPDEAYKKKIRWSVYIDGKKENRIRILGIDKTDKEERTIDIYNGNKKNKEFILYSKITPTEDKLEIKFSKWLDGKKVKVEAHIGMNSFHKPCQVDTAVIAKPEVLSINWVNAKEQKIKYTGYDQDVFLQVETLGLDGKDLNLDVLDYDKGGEDDKLDWGANSIKITGRKTLKQFPVKKKTEYGLQQKDENKPGLDLYVVVNSGEPIENCKDKYATYLDLNPDEKIITAYFAEERKKEVQKGEEKPKPKPKKETPKEPTEYTVVKGDDLAKIAKKTRVPYTQIMKANPDTVWTKLIPKKTILTIPVKKEEEKPKGKEKDTKTIIYYQKIDAAYLGSKVYLTAEAQNLEGKTVTFKVFEKKPLLISEKDTPISLLVKESEKTEIEATVNDGKAQVEVVLHRKEDKAKDDWKEKLSPQEKEVENAYHDCELDQSVHMTSFDYRLITNPERYEQVIEKIPAKSTYLWLQVTCEGDQLDFDQPFLKKTGALEVSVNTGDHGDWHEPILNPQVRGWYNSQSETNKDSKILGWNPYASMKLHKDVDHLLSDEAKKYGKPQRGSGEHNGLDIYAPVGTPVYASVEGKITMHQITKSSSGFKIKLEGQYKEEHIRFNYIHLMQFEKTRFRFYNKKKKTILPNHGWLNYKDFLSSKEWKDPDTIIIDPITGKQEVFKIHYSNGILKIDNNEIDVGLISSITNQFEADNYVKVKKGQIIGYTGSTGNSYQGKKRNHLHYNTYIKWKGVQPYEKFKDYINLDISGTETSKKQDGVTPSSKW